MNPESPGLSNVLRGYVFEGVWEKHSEPVFQRWKWTVKDSKALLILACLTCLIAFTQTRAWVLIRYIIASQTKPVRLRDDTNPEPLLHLSQGRAIVEALPSPTNAIPTLRVLVRRAFRIEADYPNTPACSDHSVVSPWFGVFSLLNMGLFITMGVAIPWFLSEGAIKAPVVKSRMTNECLTTVNYEHIPFIVNQVPMAEAVFQECQDQLSEGCDSQYYLQRPQIHKTRPETCPFPGDICHNGTKPFEITHLNITPYEVGVNSMSGLTLSHRLTCAPVYLDSFLLLMRQPPKRAFLSVKNFELDRGGELWQNFSMSLNTWNGPNIVSNESSGLRMAQEHGPFDLNVLPRYWVGSEDFSDLMHPDLRRDDRVSFLIVHRAGTKRYIRQISDPFFAAHNKVGNSFYTDHEATALGCFEQFQYCLASTGFCTPWGSAFGQPLIMSKCLIVEQDMQDVVSITDLTMYFRMLLSMSSIFNYLAQLTEWHDMVPLTRSGIYAKAFLPANTEEQWVTEVETWFMKGILHTILSVRRGARFLLSELPPVFDLKFKREFSLCSRVLFRDGDYTNINWLGIWVTIFSLILICLMSYVVGPVHKVVRTLFRGPADLLNLFTKLLTTISESSRWFLQNCRWWGTAAGLWGAIAGFFRSPLPLFLFLQQYFPAATTTRRASSWRGGPRGHRMLHSPSMQASTSAELNDLRTAAFTSTSQDSHDRDPDAISRYEDIDSII